MTNIVDRSRDIDQAEFQDPAIVIVSTSTPPLDKRGAPMLTDPSKEKVRPKPYETSRTKTLFWVTCGGPGLYLTQFLSPYKEPVRRRAAIVGLLALLGFLVWLAIQALGAYAGAKGGANWTLLPLMVLASSAFGYYLPSLERMVDKQRSDTPMEQLILDVRQQTLEAPSAYIEVANYQTETNVSTGLSRLVLDVVNSGHTALCLAANHYERDVMGEAGLVEIRNLNGLSLHTTPGQRDWLKV